MRSSCGTRKREEAEEEQEQRSEIENADEEATNERTLRSMETVKALSCFAQVSSSSYSAAAAAPLRPLLNLRTNASSVHWKTLKHRRHYSLLPSLFPILLLILRFFFVVYPFRSPA